jgi:hypothetical protein
MAIKKAGKEKKASMIDIIRKRVENAAGSGMIFIKVKDKEKKRVRILTDMDDFICVTMHDNYKMGVGFPCFTYFGKKDCPFCNTDKYGKSDGYRTRDLFIFTVYDYESKEVKLMMEAANDCSPIPTMLDFYETHGTLCDRDYVISRRGTGFDTSYTLIPGDKKRFKGEDNFEAMDEKEVFEKLKDRYFEKMKAVLKKIKDGTFGLEEDLDDDDEDEKPKKKNKPEVKPKKKAKKPVDDDDDDDDYFDDEDDEIPFDADEDEDDEDEDEDEDDDDEEEEVKPKKKLKNKLKKRK